MRRKIYFVAFFTVISLHLVSCSGGDTKSQTNAPNDVIVDSVSTSSEVNYIEVGKELAMQTKANLGKNLGMALSEKGAAGAVEFCNTRAISITDSMSVVLNAKIKRVSDKPRNATNQANADELAYIDAWKNAKSNGENYPPQLTEHNDKMIGYYPITTNAMCLQCHGVPDKQINKETLSTIKRLYPSDKAVGYAEEDIRGIFVVEMTKQ